MNKEVKIGILGGSGFYEFLSGVEEREVETPFGKTSDKISVGDLDGVGVAFLPRHGRGHKYPPHAIPYRANLWALRQLGCEQIISPAAVGSLRPEIPPGTFVICTDFLDRTKRRPDTFFDGPEVYHIPSTEAYCPHLVDLAEASFKELRISYRRGGNVVVIEGPRFSSKIESRNYAAAGGDIINMTQYPEVALARELEMCYLGIGLVTDWDVGLEGDARVKPVTAEEVARVFKDNNEKLRKFIFHLVPRIAAAESACSCRTVLGRAKI